MLQNDPWFDLGSISSTFYAQLLCAQIPKALKKDSKVVSLFCKFGMCSTKSALRMLMKLTPDVCLINILSVLYELIHFMQRICIFWHREIVEKAVCKLVLVHYWKKFFDYVNNTWKSCEPLWSYQQTRDFVKVAWRPLSKCNKMKSKRNAVIIYHLALLWDGMDHPTP